MEEDVFKQIININWEPTVSFVDIMKVPLVIVLIVCLFYSFMLFLRTKILIDTVESEENSKMKTLVFINLLVSLVISILGTIIIIVG